ncbi:DUF2938 family protein [Lysobacter niabensis]|uniref:DUF2938 family protein n=1 Tax=Agrilutibacter niabensis TaxID=380628 RepID=UPI0036193F92
MDTRALLRTRLLRVPAPDYGLVRRWIAHLVRGPFRHDSIAMPRARHQVGAHARFVTRVRVALVRARGDSTRISHKRVDFTGVRAAEVSRANRVARTNSGLRRAQRLFPSG